jgi:hypothetical protein
MMLEEPFVPVGEKFIPRRSLGFSVICPSARPAAFASLSNYLRRVATRTSHFRRELLSPQPPVHLAARNVASTESLRPDCLPVYFCDTVPRVRLLFCCHVIAPFRGMTVWASRGCLRFLAHGRLSRPGHYGEAVPPGLPRPSAFVTTA